VRHRARDGLQGASASVHLLLMALGLAIVFGMMGVTMEHGELMASAPNAVRWQNDGFGRGGPSGVRRVLRGGAARVLSADGAVGVVLERGGDPPAHGARGEAPLTWGARDHPAGDATVVRPPPTWKSPARAGSRRLRPHDRAHPCRSTALHHRDGVGERGGTCTGCRTHRPRATIRA